ncbi:kinase-like protein [Hypoxylon sp. FL0543]|nr:kinase-like protein [Hypoxylon sp. FL0543]
MRRHSRNPNHRTSRRFPKTFNEKYRASNWKFRGYREEGAAIPGARTAAEYRTIWMGHPLPIKGRGGTRRRVPFVRQAFLAVERPEDSNLQTRRQEARTWFERVAHLHYVKTLGFGGLGLAMKFRSRPPARIPNRDLVIKISRQSWESEDIRGEARETRKLVRAAHCIQQIDPSDIGLTPARSFQFEEPDIWDSSVDDESSGSRSREDKPKRPRTRKWRMGHHPEDVRAKIQRKMDEHRNWEERMNKRNEMEERLEDFRSRARRPNFNVNAWDLNRKDYIILEFMEYGDLAQLLYKLNEFDEEVPNRVLWHFWLCLVKACIAMEYPPRKYHPLRRDPVVDSNELVNDVRGKRIGNDLFEDLPSGNPPLPGKRMVHFDIDPRNILVGGFDLCSGDSEHEHEIVPRLKLADFGLAEEIKPNKANMYYLKRRPRAKVGYFAPEQFGVEWERIAPNDPRGFELALQKVAGQYGPWTNIWGIALTMWQLITKSRVPIPPQLQSGRRPRHPHYTWCPLLLEEEFAHVDIELRQTLIDCMRNEPKLRPSLSSLLQGARTGVKKSFPGESDQEIRDWIQKMFRNAPAPAPAPAPSSDSSSDDSGP